MARAGGSLMPIPRIDFITGKSGNAIAIPKISRERSAISARSRTVDPHASQLGTSRDIPSAGRAHSVPQRLQMNFAESKDFKSRPPVAIVDDVESFLVKAPPQ